MYYLGIDIGSSYTKVCLINEKQELLTHFISPTFSRDIQKLKLFLQECYDLYKPEMICATGYGRDSFAKESFHIPCIEKTEIFCAVAGISHKYNFDKTVIDIGGEDVKVIKTGANGQIIDFYMNSKCASGTGSFIMETALKADIDISEMSQLAAASTSKKEINSFCTVFAKTEILQWLLNKTSIQDISRGIYLSICHRISKLKIDPELPIILVGGVIAHHPYLKNILEESMKQSIFVPEMTQIIPALGAAIMAKKTHNR